MLRLFKFALALGLLLGLVAFTTMVKLGQRTLFEHVRAIAGSKESQELVRGTEEAARPLVDRVRHAAGRLSDPAPGGGGQGGQDGKNGKDGQPAAQPAAPATGGAGAAAGSAQTQAESISETDRKKLRRVLGEARTRPRKKD